MMCTTVVKRIVFKTDMSRYEKYAEAKARIPKDLPADEYERRIKELAKKFKV